MVELDDERLVVRGRDAEGIDRRLDVGIRGVLGEVEDFLAAVDVRDDGLVVGGRPRVDQPLPGEDEVVGDDRVAVAVLRVTELERVGQAVLGDLGQGLRERRNDVLLLVEVQEAAIQRVEDRDVGRRLRERGIERVRDPQRPDTGEGPARRRGPHTTPAGRGRSGCG